MSLVTILMPAMKFEVNMIGDANECVAHVDVVVDDFRVFLFGIGSELIK